MEKDKNSEVYKTLRIIGAVVRNFRCWSTELERENNYAEATYQRKLADILGILLEDEDVTVFDGGKVSTDTRRSQILKKEV